MYCAVDKPIHSFFFKGRFFQKSVLLFINVLLLDKLTVTDNAKILNKNNYWHLDDDSRLLPQQSLAEHLWDSQEV